MLFVNSKVLFRSPGPPISEYIGSAETAFPAPASLWNIKSLLLNSQLNQHQQIVANFADTILSYTELIAPGPEKINGLAKFTGKNSDQLPTVKFPNLLISGYIHR